MNNEFGGFRVDKEDLELYYKLTDRFEKVVRHAVADYYRQKYLQFEIPTESPFGDALLLADGSDIQEALDRILIEDCIQRALSTFTSQEKNAYELLFVKDLRPSEAASILDISCARVSALQAAILRKIRKALEE